MSRILVVEDESAIAELIAINLRHAGFEATIASSAEQAQAEIEHQLPDLVLLDWMLPGLSGLTLARLWRGQTRTKDLPLIMLTARGAESDKVCGLEAGADDYVTKPFSLKELMARVRAVLRRRAPEALDELVDVGGLQLDPATRKVSCHGQDAKVGPTEFRLLHYMMTHPERVHSRSQLLNKVWGDQVALEERTIDVHVMRLREALGTVQCAGMVDTVRGLGYRFTASQPTVAHQ